MARRHGEADFFYPPSQPRRVEGGIRMQSGRRAVGQRWWSRRWIEALEALELGGRLTRGRSYARQGQVVALDIASGGVSARVQGSRLTPYEVRIGVTRIPSKGWKSLTALLTRRPIFVAKLLSGEMPDGIEDAFREAGLSLFPARIGDLKTRCSCPDWSNPCKHIAAVYYLLGEEFDRDPFLLFTLRGMERDKLLALLGAHPTTAAATTAASTADEPPPEPLSVAPEVFWAGPATPETGNARADAYPEDVTIPTTSATLLRRLGRFPFWRGQDDFFITLDAVYRAASLAGQNVFLGQHRREHVGDLGPTQGSARGQPR